MAADKTASPAHLGNFDFIHKQHGLTALDYCHFVQIELAGEIILQMHQTTPPHQEVSGQQRELSQDGNLVRRVHLRSNCHC